MKVFNHCPKFNTLYNKARTKKNLSLSDFQDAYGTVGGQVTLLGYGLIGHLERRHHASPITFGALYGLINFSPMLDFEACELTGFRLPDRFKTILDMAVLETDRLLSAIQSERSGQKLDTIEELCKGLRMYLDISNRHSLDESAANALGAVKRVLDSISLKCSMNIHDSITRVDERASKLLNLKSSLLSCESEEKRGIKLQIRSLAESIYESNIPDEQRYNFIACAREFTIRESNEHSSNAISVVVDGIQRDGDCLNAVIDSFINAK